MNLASLWHPMESWLDGELLQYGFMVFWALIIFVLGIWLAGRLRKHMDFVLKRRKVDSTVRLFLNQLVYGIFLVIVCIIALSRLGVQTASIVALLASISFAIGLALQGTLSHLAAGILLVIMRPFKVGDSIEVAGVAGTVQVIEIMFTHLLTGDNKAIAIPNGKILTDSITNLSLKKTRRIDVTFRIAYGDSIAKAREVIMDVLKAEPRVLDQPVAPKIWVSALSDSAVVMTVQLWSLSANLPDLSYTLTEAVKLGFDAVGITIPYPQREVFLRGDLESIGQNSEKRVN